MEDRSPYAPAEQAAYPDPNIPQLSSQGPFYSNPTEQSQDIAEKFIQDAAKFALQPNPGEPPRQPNDSHGYAPHPGYGDVGLHDDVEMRHSADQGHMAQGIMDGMSIEQQHQVFGQQGLEGSQRKRTKVSRACDECRRKKIRCDATDVDSIEPCSSCKKIGQACLFSRQPLKRGPSKGYIKELAERLNTLESQLGNTPQHQQQLQQSNPQQLPARQDVDDSQIQQIGYRELAQQLREASPIYNGSRKRTLSVSDGRVHMQPSDSTQALHYPADRPRSEEMSRQFPVTPELSADHVYSVSAGRDLPPGNHSQQPLYLPSNGARRGGSGDYRQQVPNSRPGPEARQDPLQTLEWDEEVIDE